MKIVCLLRALGVGGVERQLTGLSVFLKKAGHDVSIMKYHPQNFYEDFLKENNVPIVYIPKNKGTLDLCRRMADYFKENKVDVVISFSIGANMKACIARMMYKDFKLVVSERNYNHNFYPTEYIRFVAYNKADRIVSNSHAQNNFIKNKFPSKAPKCQAIVNFVDLAKFHPAETSPDNKVTHIVTTARVTKRKNVHGYILAARALVDKGYRFTIDWYGYARKSKYYYKCMELIEKNGLQDVFHIHAAAKNVTEIYHSADLFCLPSFYEGTSNSICEAIASGLPVACSDVSDSGIYVQPGRNGWLFDPEKPQTLIDALSEALDAGKEKLQEYGRTSRVIAEEKLSIEKFTEEYIELINDLTK